MGYFDLWKGDFHTKPKSPVAGVGQLEEWLNIQLAPIEGGQCDPVSAFMARTMVPGPDGEVLLLSEKFRQ